MSEAKERIGAMSPMLIATMIALVCFIIIQAMYIDALKDTLKWYQEQVRLLQEKKGGGDEQ